MSDLFGKIARDIDYALANAGGSATHGGHRDSEAWRHMEREQLVAHLVAFLRAGLGPELDRDAVERGTQVARHIITAWGLKPPQ